MTKERLRNEILAFRIINKNLLSIIKAVPFELMTPLTFSSLIDNSIKETQIFNMYVDLYATLGAKIYKSQLRLVKNIKSGPDSSFNEIMRLWLVQNSGTRIVSVHSTLIAKVKEIIAQGYEQNLSTREIAKNLEKNMAWYKGQMLRIARTETTTVTNASTLMAGNSSDLLLEKQWISAQDNRTRTSPFDHLEMNGVKVAQDKQFVVSGEELDYPGDMKNGSAGNIINCRCSIVLVPVRDKDGRAVRKGETYIPAEVVIPEPVKPKSDAFSIVTEFENSQADFDVQEYVDEFIKIYDLKDTISVRYSIYGEGGSTSFSELNGVQVASNYVKVNGKLSPEQIKAVIRHELRHVQQMQTGQFELKNGYFWWNGEKVLSVQAFRKIAKSRTTEGFLKYVNFPWELDAHRQGDAFGTLLRYGIKEVVMNGQPTDWLSDLAGDEPDGDPVDYTELDKLILNL